MAEDDESNALLIEKALRRRGHYVRVVGNGRDALRLLNLPLDPDDSSANGRDTLASPYDLLLLDLHMPELDGFAVVERIRESERTTGTHLPVIALTARSRAEDRERCFAAGIDDVFVKPFRIADVLLAVAGFSAASQLLRRGEP